MNNNAEPPKVEMARVHGKSLVLSVVADGKRVEYQLDIYTLMGLMESGFETLKIVLGWSRWNS